MSVLQGTVFTLRNTGFTSTVGMVGDKVSRHFVSARLTVEVLYSSDSMTLSTVGLVCAARDRLYTAWRTTL